MAGLLGRYGTRKRKHLSRVQLNILGTDSVKFSITGMVINSVNRKVWWMY
jgi:hypothetical protein